MSRIYGVPFAGDITAANGDADLLLVTPAANKPCRLAGYFLGQISEAQDSEEKNLDLSVRHFTATVTPGTGGSAPTPATTPNQAAAGFTCRVLDTAVATTSGTNTLLGYIPWNVRNNPWPHYFPEEFRRMFTVINGAGLIVRLETALPSTVTFRGTWIIEEQG